MLDLARAGRFGEAEDKARELVARRPENRAARRLLATVLFEGAVRGRREDPDDASRGRPRRRRDPPDPGRRVRSRAPVRRGARNTRRWHGGRGTTRSGRRPGRPSVSSASSPTSTRTGRGAQDPRAAGASEESDTTRRPDPARGRPGRRGLRRRSGAREGLRGGRSAGTRVGRRRGRVHRPSGSQQPPRRSSTPSRRPPTSTRSWPPPTPTPVSSDSTPRRRSRGGPSKFPENTEAQFRLASSLERAGHSAEAEKVFLALLAERPNDSAAQNYLGYMWADKGVQLERARDLLEKAVAREPRNAAYLDSLGWAYFRLGRLDVAEKNLREAHVASPDPTIVEHLGDLEMQRGDIAERCATGRRPSSSSTRSPNASGSSCSARAPPFRSGEAAPLLGPLLLVPPFLSRLRRPHRPRDFPPASGGGPATRWRPGPRGGPRRGPPPSRLLYDARMSSGAAARGSRARSPCRRRPGSAPRLSDRALRLEDRRVLGRRRDGRGSPRPGRRPPGVARGPGGNVARGPVGSGRLRRRRMPAGLERGDSVEAILDVGERPVRSMVIEAPRAAVHRLRRRSRTLARTDRPAARSARRGASRCVWPAAVERALGARVAHEVDGPGPAKINRELRVGRIRPDGYHELRSRMVSIDLADRLSAEPSEGLEFSCDDPAVPSGADEPRRPGRAASGAGRGNRAPRA